MPIYWRMIADATGAILYARQSDNMYANFFFKVLISAGN